MERSSKLERALDTERMQRTEIERGLDKLLRTDGNTFLLPRLPSSADGCEGAADKINEAPTPLADKINRIEAALCAHSEQHQAEMASRLRQELQPEFDTSELQSALQAERRLPSRLAESTVEVCHRAVGP